MQTAQPLVLRPKRAKMAGLGLGTLLFVLTGLWMVRDGDAFGWLIVGFFGLCLLVFLALLLPGAAYLALDSEGFTMCSLFRAHTLRWADVTGFGIGRVLTNKMVMFNFVDSYRPTPGLRTLNSNLVGFEAALPDSYGLSHEALAQLMNQYKAASHGA